MGKRGAAGQPPRPTTSDASPFPTEAGPPCRDQRRKRSPGGPSGKCQILRAHSRAVATCVPANSRSHVRRERRFSKRVADASLIGNEPYSKTPGFARRQSPSSRGGSPYKITARASQEAPSEPPIIPDVNPHVLCDRLIQNPPRSSSDCHLSPRQAGFAPHRCMGCLRLVRQ